MVRYFFPLKWLGLPAVLTSAMFVTGVCAAEQAVSAAGDAATYSQDGGSGDSLPAGQGPGAGRLFRRQAGPGVTAVVTAAILRHGRSPNDPAVAKSLKYLQRFVQPDGAISLPKSVLPQLRNVAGADVLRRGQPRRPLRQTHRRRGEVPQGEPVGGARGHDESSPNYGGAGYGKHKRPDLSNTQFLVDALQAAGAGPDDEAMKRALVFVSRCQNLESEHNTHAVCRQESPTAASSIPRPPAARARPARRPTAGCAATAR